ncbi:hypothetical protein LEP1GSC133_0436 [Leptospira borgpetersenii serovar Pomona str. 200901868]|nr:hypothetical protein LEP1GSC133_0436 [Leptospira borgpetersenii serovar Pomona str. 200901868]
MSGVEAEFFSEFDFFHEVLPGFINSEDLKVDRDQVEKTEKKPIYFTSSFKISCLF